MSDEMEELAVGESLPVSEEGPLQVKTTRTDEHLFTTAYRDVDSGQLRLVLQVDITTGATALDPRSFDAGFWTLRVRGDERPGTALREALASFDDPGLEVHPKETAIHIYSDEEDEAES
mgnify:CR=1 FL=1